jgi:hypothetical protein
VFNQNSFTSSQKWPPAEEVEPLPVARDERNGFARAPLLLFLLVIIYSLRFKNIRYFRFVKQIYVDTF